MLILVDYDNISRFHRRFGISYIVDKIIRALGMSKLKKEHRIIIRLYGGWYILNTLTKEAQTLAAEIQRDFPKPVIVSQGSYQHTVTVGVELAYSLAIDPATHLWHTYRPRGFPNNLVCEDPVALGCKNPACPLQSIYKFFDKGSCPHPGCNITPFDLLHKAEQKLVDTMITSDMIFYASNKKEVLCLVTSDDDLWPAVISTLKYGASVFHIHTHATRSTPIYYVQSAGSNYVQITL